MKLLRHGVAALVIFGSLVILLTTIYAGFESEYGIQKNYTKVISGQDVDIGTALQNLQVVRGVNNTVSSIYKIANPAPNAVDIIGALLATGVGVIQLASGLVTLPFQIVGVITIFYGLPVGIAAGFLLMIIVYVGFIVVSAFTRGEV